MVPFHLIPSSPTKTPHRWLLLSGPLGGYAGGRAYPTGLFFGPFPRFFGHVPNLWMVAKSGCRCWMVNIPWFTRLKTMFQPSFCWCRKNAGFRNHPPYGWQDLSSFVFFFGTEFKSWLTSSTAFLAQNGCPSWAPKLDSGRLWDSQDGPSKLCYWCITTSSSLTSSSSTFSIPSLVDDDRCRYKSYQSSFLLAKWPPFDLPLVSNFFRTWT